ncbi:MAG: regulator [Gammaproteobacteria bacterium]|nr:regulator [Gammaproteobacteria bacterium]
MLKRSLMLTAVLLAAGCSDSASTGAEKVGPIAKQAAVKPVMAEKAWKVIDAFEVGPEIYVRSMALDPSANSLWVGTSAGVHEVNLATQELRHTFTRADGLANEYVFATYVDRDGNKWFGTNGGGVSRYRDDKWKVYFPMHGLADYWVYSFAQQKSGPVWIGTWAGVNRWQSDDAKLDTYVKELVNEWVYGIDVDQQDRVWFGTEGGVSMFNGQQWQSWTHKEGLGAPNEDNLPISFNTGLGTRSRHDLSLLTQGEPTYNPNYVFAIHVDRKNQIWAGTWGGGVGRFDGAKWTNYNTRNGLAGNVVYSIAEAEDGALWLGTDHGVSRFDGEAWQNYGRSDGVLSDHVYAVAAIPGGEVWLGTRGGVTRLGLKTATPEAGKKP